MLHTFDGPCNHIFSCISHFSCRSILQKYASWVLLGWGIKFCIQRVLPLEVKTLGDKLKIGVEKVVLLFYYFLFFLQIGRAHV